jgi:hypothetical protein
MLPYNRLDSVLLGTKVTYTFVRMWDLVGANNKWGTN